MAWVEVHRVLRPGYWASQWNMAVCCGRRRCMATGEVKLMYGVRVRSAQAAFALMIADSTEQRHFISLMLTTTTEPLFLKLLKTSKYSNLPDVAPPANQIEASSSPHVIYKGMDDLARDITPSRYIAALPCMCQRQQRPSKCIPTHQSVTALSYSLSS